MFPIRYFLNVLHSHITVLHSHKKSGNGYQLSPLLRLLFSEYPWHWHWKCVQMMTVSVRLFRKVVFPFTDSFFIYIIGSLNWVFYFQMCLDSHLMCWWWQCPLPTWVLLPMINCGDIKQSLLLSLPIHFAFVLGQLHLQPGHFAKSLYCHIRPL